MESKACDCSFPMLQTDIATLERQESEKAVKGTIMVFSGDFDKAMFAFVHANAMAAQGMDVMMIFAFWGLNIVRKEQSNGKGGKGLIQRMLGVMNRGGASRLPMSRFNIGGVGTRLMKHIMRDNNFPTLLELKKNSQELGVKFYVCEMSMKMTGVSAEDLIPEIEGPIGCATYISNVMASKMYLFVS